MKKALLATTALVLSAGVATADVTISGYGRTGIIYYENSGLVESGDNETRVVSRLRMNLDASTETDSGVEFGARFRLQWDQGDGLSRTLGAVDDGDALGVINGVLGSRGTSASTNAGKLWISAQGLTVEIGNVDTAMDNAGLIYATELGAFDRSVGFSDVTGNFFAYSAGPYSLQQVDRVGVAAIYSFGDLTVRASYIDPDQSGVMDVLGVDAVEKELSLAVDYTWDSRLELSAAAAFNGAGVDNNDIFFLGARYAVLDNARVGLNYMDADDSGDGKTVALYGDYTLADGLTNLEAYVAHNDPVSGATNETDTAFGIGVNYDLGGARLGASIQRDYDKDVTADMGVRFNF